MSSSICAKGENTSSISHGTIRQYNNTRELGTMGTGQVCRSAGLPGGGPRCLSPHLATILTSIRWPPIHIFHQNHEDSVANAGWKEKQTSKSFFSALWILLSTLIRSNSFGDSFGPEICYVMKGAQIIKSFKSSVWSLSQIIPPKIVPESVKLWGGIQEAERGSEEGQRGRGESGCVSAQSVTRVALQSMCFHTATWSPAKPLIRSVMLQTT